MGLLIQTLRLTRHLFVFHDATTAMADRVCFVTPHFHLQLAAVRASQRRLEDDVGHGCIGMGAFGAILRSCAGYGARVDQVTQRRDSGGSARYPGHHVGPLRQPCGDPQQLGAFADKPLMYLPPRRGKTYMKSILENTFALEPRMVEPDYVGMLSYFASNQKGRSLIVVLTDLTDPTGSQALLAGIAGLSTRHLVFCVTLKDRQIINSAKPQILPANAPNEEVMGSIYRRAVATDLLEQRELALSVLQRRGCLVLDCPPQELSDKLVDAYLEVKTRGRL